MTTAASLDETALRRPEFTEGYQVVLGDGRPWTFPKPKLGFYPGFSADGKTIEVKMFPPYGREYHEATRPLFEIPSDGDADVSIDLLVCSGAELLARNYALDASALETLLPFDPTLAEPSPMWTAVYRVIQGMKPPEIPTAA